MGSEEKPSYPTYDLSFSGAGVELILQLLDQENYTEPPRAQYSRAVPAPHQGSTIQPTKSAQI